MELIKNNIPLSQFTTFKIGGNGYMVYEVTTQEELKDALSLICKNKKLPWIVLGGGSNVLINDKGFAGLVIINRLKGIEVKDNGYVIVNSGEETYHFVEYSCKLGLSGAEFLAGIPGTIGGAICGNAGAWGKEIGEIVEEVHLITPELKKIVLKREELKFGYRHSILKEREELFVEKVVFKLNQGDPKKINKKINEILKIRKDKLPDSPSAGSVFKNIITEDGKKIPVAYYLERVGVKGLKIGGAMVYENHANIIINRGNATANDVIMLMKEMKVRVSSTFNIELIPEIVFIGDKGKIINFV